MTGATVRVLDETGKAIATNKPVAAGTGAYGPIPLTGTGPFRVEACGTVGDHALCVWGATTAGGTLNLTPLSSAITVLAGGQPPETLMTGPVQGLSDSALTTAHAQLRTALTAALADAGLDPAFDLLAGPLTPGSHTGYDRVLDTVNVGLGLDSKAYVTLASPLGTGPAYLEAGTTLGSLAFNAAAANVDFTGIDGLYQAMGPVLTAATGCTSSLPALLDANARASVDLVTTFAGIGGASQLLCSHMQGVLAGDVEPLIGAKLLPTTPGRCDFSGADPVCRVALVFQTAKGLLRQVGVEQAVVKRPSPVGWRFLGNRLEVQATAVARVVLARRADQAAADGYARYLDVSIPAYAGLQCARVSQKDTSGADVPLAFYKPTGSGSYLSLWTNGSPALPSLDPLNGATLGNDLVALALPSGTAGDATVRNFVRAGRGLKVELFSDAGCGAPLAGADNGAVSIDVAGQLPLNFVGLSGLPWPVLPQAAVSKLVSLNGSVNAKLSYGPTWTLARPGLAVNRIQLCTDAACAGKLAELELAGTAAAAGLNWTQAPAALGAGAYKLLRLTGRTADGLVMQLDLAACAAQPAGQPC
jgi:hypothetical protein